VAGEYGAGDEIEGGFAGGVKTETSTFAGNFVEFTGIGKQVSTDRHHLSELL